MDSDDAAVPHLLETQVRYFQENEHVDVLTILPHSRWFSNGEWSPKVNSSSTEIIPKKDSDELEYDIIVANTLPHPGTLIRRATALRYPYNDVGCEDYDRWLRMVLSSL